MTLLATSLVSRRWSAVSPSNPISSLGRRRRPPLVRLASTRFTSSLDPRPPIYPPFCVLRSVVTCIHAVPLSQTVHLSIPVHIARGRFLDQFRSRVPHHRSGPPQSLPLHSYGSYFRSCNFTFRPLLDLFSPLPTYPVRSGHALVHSFYYHRVSPVLSLSVACASGILVLKHIVV